MVYISTDKNNQVNLKIIVQPKAKRTTFRGLYDDMLRLNVAAPPVDGKANREVITYLADFFGLKKKDIKIVGGEHSRKKRCSIRGLDEGEVRRRVEAHLLS